jgi:hypothetical protein
MKINHNLGIHTTPEKPLHIKASASGGIVKNERVATTGAVGSNSYNVETNSVTIPDEFDVGAGVSTDYQIKTLSENDTQIGKFSWIKLTDNFNWYFKLSSLGRTIVDFLPALTTSGNLSSSTNSVSFKAGNTTEPFKITTTGVDANIDLELSAKGSGNVKVTGADAVVNDARIGKGSGNIASNTIVGNGTLSANTTGFENTAIGNSVLNSNTTGFRNTALGNNVLSSNTIGQNNIGIGNSTLNANTTGNNNIGIGVESTLNNNTTGAANIGIGTNVLSSNTAGFVNIGIGISALNSNTTGGENIAIGSGVLSSSTTASGNIAIGSSSLGLNTFGNVNTAVGYNVLSNNTTGGENVGVGVFALNKNTTGSINTGVGSRALRDNTTGGGNTGIGENAAHRNLTGSENVAVGAGALANGTNISGNTSLGYVSLHNSTGNNNIGIGRNCLQNYNSGNGSIAIGAGLDMPSTTDSQLNIGAVIYATGIHSGATQTFVPVTSAKVGIGTFNPLSAFDVASTVNGSRPFPLMTETERLAIALPATGLFVYQTNGIEGLYMRKSSGWVFIA